MSLSQPITEASSQGSDGCLFLNADSKEDLINLIQTNREEVRSLRNLTIVVPWGSTKHEKGQVLIHLIDMTRYLRDKLTSGQTAVDYTFGLSDWNMRTALEYLEPLRNLPKLASLRIKTIPHRSQIAEEERISFVKHCRNFACKVVKVVSTPQIKNLPFFPFQKLPKEIQDMVLANTSLVSPLHRGIQTLVPKYATRSLPECCGQCGPGLRCWCPTPTVVVAYSPTCECNPSTSSLFLVNHAIRAQSQEIYYTHNTFNLGGHSFESLCKEIHQIPKTVFPRLRKLHVRLVASGSPYHTVPKTTWGSESHQKWRDILRILSQSCQLNRVRIKFSLRKPRTEVRQYLDRWPEFLSYRHEFGLLQCSDLEIIDAAEEWPCF